MLEQLTNGHDRLSHQKRLYRHLPGLIWVGMEEKLDSLRQIAPSRSRVQCSWPSVTLLRTLPGKKEWKREREQKKDGRQQIIYLISW